MLGGLERRRGLVWKGRAIEMQEGFGRVWGRIDGLMDDVKDD